MPLRGEHRDPFDRLLAAQAIQRGAALVSRDRKMSAYEDIGLRIVW
jgi:PIN domain nuclease of toxin-antitoxin system